MAVACLIEVIERFFLRPPRDDFERRGLGEYLEIWLAGVMPVPEYTK
jgi:hypothetical protein